MTTYSYESEKQARVRAEAKDLGWETPTKWGQRTSKEVIGAVAPEQMHWRQKKMTSEDEIVTTQWALKWHVKLLNRVLRLKLPVWCKFLKIMVLYWDQNKNRQERTSRWWQSYQKNLENSFNILLIMPKQVFLTFCDIMVYNKKYIWSLSEFLGRDPKFLQIS